MFVEINPEKMQFFFTDKLIEISGLKNVEQKIYDKYYRPIDIYYQHGDSSELVDLTNWKPEISIEQTLEDLLKYWLNKNKLMNNKKVFVSGCFDILHAGHIKLLYKAKTLGNDLYVGIDSDKRVKKVKALTDL